MSRGNCPAFTHWKLCPEEIASQRAEGVVGKGMQKKPQNYAAVGMLPIFFVALVLGIWNNGFENAHGWADIAMFGVFILLMIWLLTPRRKRPSEQAPTE